MRRRFPRPRSLRGRVTLVAVLVLLGATAATLVVSAVLLRATLLARLDRQLAAASARSGMAVEADGDADDVVPGQAVGTLDVQLRDGRVSSATIVDGDGRVRALTLDAAGVRQLADVPAGGGPRSVDLDGLDDYRVRAVTTADGPVRITGLPQEDVDETLERQALSEAALFALVIAVGGLVTTRWVRRTMRPLDAVTVTAREVAALPLTRAAPALPTTARPARPAAEVEQLRSAFELMLDHVRDALAARDATEQRLRRFVADAGHELRTPLATVRVNAEQAIRDRTDVPEPTAAALARIDAAAVRMAALVEDLLLLARLDATGALGREPVDLVRVAAEVVSEAQPLAPGHHWRLDLPADAVTVTGDAERLHQVVSNLVGNARQHTPAGTTVTVAVRREAAAASVVVTDDGPGIPAVDQVAVFDRFTRGDGGRARPAGGAGLGLAIARGLAAAHGGTLEVESRPGHTAFTLRVPTA